MFEELDDEHQVEFLRERSDEQVAAVLARMASDDAADLLLEIQQERRLPVLNLLPAAKQRKIKGLLGYNPSTAGGLMNPDFVVRVSRRRPSARRCEQVRASALGDQQIATVCVVDERRAAGRIRCRSPSWSAPSPATAVVVADRDQAADASPPRPRCRRSRG